MEYIETLMYDTVLASQQECLVDKCTGVRIATVQSAADIVESAGHTVKEIRDANPVLVVTQRRRGLNLPSEIETLSERIANECIRAIYINGKTAKNATIIVYLDVYIDVLPPVAVCTWIVSLIAKLGARACFFASHRLREHVFTTIPATITNGGTACKRDPLAPEWEPYRYVASNSTTAWMFACLPPGLVDTSQTVVRIGNIVQSYTRQSDPARHCEFQFAQLRDEMTRAVETDANSLDLDTATRNMFHISYIVPSMVDGTDIGNPPTFSATFSETYRNGLLLVGCGETRTATISMTTADDVYLAEHLRQLFTMTGFKRAVVASLCPIRFKNVRDTRIDGPFATLAKKHCNMFVQLADLVRPSVIVCTDAFAFALFTVGLVAAKTKNEVFDLGTKYRVNGARPVLVTIGTTANIILVPLLPPVTPVASQDLVTRGYIEPDWKMSSILVKWRDTPRVTTADSGTKKDKNPKEQTPLPPWPSGKFVYDSSLHLAYRQLRATASRSTQQTIASMFSSH